MPPRARPLSPHLQIYRWQIGSTLSILHRITGAALALGLLMLSYWLISLAGGAAPYAAATRALASPVGLIALIGWSFAFLYHLLNGIRHLFWDAGVGFERSQRHLSGWVVVLAALGATACLWGVLLSGMHR